MPGNPLMRARVGREGAAWLTNPGWLKSAVATFTQPDNPYLFQPKPCQVVDVEPNAEGDGSLNCVLNDGEISIGCRLEKQSVDAWRDISQCIDTSKLNGTTILIGNKPPKYTIKLNHRLKQFTLSVHEFACISKPPPAGESFVIGRPSHVMDDIASRQAFERVCAQQQQLQQLQQQQPQLHQRLHPQLAPAPAPAPAPGGYLYRLVRYATPMECAAFPVEASEPHRLMHNLLEMPAEQRRMLEALREEGGDGETNADGETNVAANGCDGGSSGGGRSGGGNGEICKDGSSPTSPQDPRGLEEPMLPPSHLPPTHLSTSHLVPPARPQAEGQGGREQVQGEGAQAAAAAADEAAAQQPCTQAAADEGECASESPGGNAAFDEDGASAEWGRYDGSSGYGGGYGGVSGGVSGYGGGGGQQVLPATMMQSQELLVTQPPMTQAPLTQAPLTQANGVSHVAASARQGTKRSASDVQRGNGADASSAVALAGSMGMPYWPVVCPRCNACCGDVHVALGSPLPCTRPGEEPPDTLGLRTFDVGALFR